MDNLDIIKSAQNGNREDLYKLIKIYEKDLYRVASSILKNENDTLDVIQDTIVKVFKNIEKLEKPEYFKTWIIKILINNCYTLTKRRNKVVILEEYVSTSYENNVDEKLDIHKAINMLEDDLRIIIILYYFQDMGLRDISEVLRIPEGTIKSRLSRARKNLRNILDSNERSCV